MREKFLRGFLYCMAYYISTVLAIGMLTAIADTFTDRTIYKALLSLLKFITFWG